MNKHFGRCFVYLVHSYLKFSLSKVI